VGVDEELVAQLIQRASELAGQRSQHSTGPLWYDTMLATFKEVTSGARQAAKAQQLIQLAAGDRRALAHARQRVLAEGENDRSQQAADLLTEALLTAPPS
jgi:hypothetical protein